MVTVEICCAFCWFGLHLKLLRFIASKNQTQKNCCKRRQKKRISKEKLTNGKRKTFPQRITSFLWHFFMLLSSNFFLSSFWINVFLNESWNLFFYLLSSITTVSPMTDFFSAANQFIHEFCKWWNYHLMVLAIVFIDILGRSKVSIDLNDLWFPRNWASIELLWTIS